MNDAANDDGSAQTPGGATSRRRVPWLVALGIGVTVLSIAWLAVTEPAGTPTPLQPRTWAVGLLLIGLGITVASLLPRSTPAAKQPPNRPSWLLLVAAACGLITPRPSSAASRC